MKSFSTFESNEFDEAALRLFRKQFSENTVYQSYCRALKKSPENVTSIEEIPFLPIGFFKSHSVICGDFQPQEIFTSSGTTGDQTSRHFVRDLTLYEDSFRSAFYRFYGDIRSFCVLALLPSYLERSGSSLIYMAADLIEKSDYSGSGFFLNDFHQLKKAYEKAKLDGKKVLLLGVSFALWDLAEWGELTLDEDDIVMETGGMKGRRRELVRTELHEILCNGLGVKKIHSEYGMTELLSQAYSLGDGIFECPPWMKILVRDPMDPKDVRAFGSGAINVIDLANEDSCAFIATMDLCKVAADGSFEVLGRFDASDVRGCNLMVG